MSGKKAAHEAVPRDLGRYVLHDEFASGGMATVHFGRRVGPAGFSLTVAIKRLHPQFAKDPEIVASLLDEARVAARIRHPNVVSILDVVTLDDEIFLAMDYIEGESLARLLAAANERGERMPLPLLVGVMVGVLHGLHAAHEAKTERGEPLSLVHRDVSLRNVLVGVDGVPRLLDFGIAKAFGRVQTTREGEFKGTLGYSPPEQILRKNVDRRSDIYAASVVLFRLLTGRAPFEGDEASLLYDILHGEVPAPSHLVPEVSRGMDRVVLRGLARNMEDRFETALEMADALEDIAAPATPREIARWVEQLAADSLRERAERLSCIERSGPVALSSGPHVHASRAPDPLPGGGAYDVTARLDVSATSPAEISGTRPRRVGWRSLFAGSAALACVASITLLRFDGPAIATARTGLREATSHASPAPPDSSLDPEVSPPPSADPAETKRPRVPAVNPAARSNPSTRRPGAKPHGTRAPGERDYGF